MNPNAYSAETRHAFNEAVRIGIVDATELACLIAAHCDARKVIDGISTVARVLTHGDEGPMREKHAMWAAVEAVWMDANPVVGEGLPDGFKVLGAHSARIEQYIGTDTCFVDVQTSLGEVEVSLPLADVFGIINSIVVYEGDSATMRASRGLLRAAIAPIVLFKMAQLLK
jgi:hypothetical protein